MLALGLKRHSRRVVRLVALCLATSATTLAGATPANSQHGLAYAAGDDTAALGDFSAAAEAGDAAVQHRLGELYFDGRGVARDYAMALKWFRRAAEQGFAAAQCMVGVSLHSGLGVARDYAQAMTWYRRAAEQEIGRAHV